MASLTVARRRRLADYLAATRNEIVVDEHLLALSNLRAQSAGHIPRAARWVPIAKRFPHGVRLLAALVVLAWRLGGGALFLFADFLPRWRQAPAASRTALPSPAYVLGLSSRVSDVVRPELLSDLPETWITMPWAPMARLPAGVRAIDVFSLLSRDDLRQALVDALVASRHLGSRARIARWALQSYTAFKWFAVRAAIDRLEGELVMAEHFDRWAVLVDRSVRSRRRRLTLIQHGAVAGLDGGGQSEYGLPRLPTKLQCVSRLFVYGDADEAVFRRAILGAAVERNGLEVQHFKPSITMQPRSTQGVALLFIGHPLCEPLQEAIFAELRKRIAVDAFYKPHPLAPMSASMKTVGWHLITEADHFPAVDLVISYPSTLVVEYGAVGVPAVVHPLTADIAARDDVVHGVLARAGTVLQPPIA